MEAKDTKDETSNLLSVEKKSPFYSNAQEYQDMNYGNLYQPILNESQGRPFQQDFNYYPPSIQDCRPDPAPAEQPPSYYNHINPNPVEYYQPLPADQQKINAQPIPAMQNPVVATRRNQSFDIRIIASICMIVMALLLSNFVLLLCIVPSIYCIYKGNTERDEEEKKRYTRLALCSSFCLIIASFFVLFLWIGFIILVGIINSSY